MNKIFHSFIHLVDVDSTVLGTDNNEQHTEIAALMELYILPRET